MKYIMTYDSLIEYPYTSSITHHNITPFMRIYKDDQVFYGIANKSIQLVELHKKPITSLTLLKSYEIPLQSHIEILNQITKQIRGMHYKLLYVYNNQYLCLGFIKNTPVAFVCLTIDLNTKGYYEIVDIKDIVENITITNQSR